MENPPAYDEVCRRDQDVRPQQVTLTLMIPPAATEQDQPTDQPGEEVKEQDTTQVNMEPPPYEVATEPPPKYTEELTLEEKLQEAGLLSDKSANENSRLGADMIFILAFVIAFIFNWIGFIFAYCLSISMAGRYGALAGFGASMVKWSIIALNSECCTEYVKSAACLLVALVVCGFLIFVRGIYLYIKFKAQMHKGGPDQKPLYVVYNQM